MPVLKLKQWLNHIKLIKISSTKISRDLSEDNKKYEILSSVQINK